MNSIYNFFQDTHQGCTKDTFLNEIHMHEVLILDDYANLEISRQQAISSLELEKLSLETPVTKDIFNALKSKFSCFIEKLYYSEKFSFNQIAIKLLRENSLYFVLNGEQELSFNIFVDEEDMDCHSENEEEVFLSYKKNGKECITCDSIPKIFSIIDEL